MTLSRLWGHSSGDSFYISFCRWEYLRRRKDYRLAYDGLMKKYPKRGFPQQVVDKFIKKWGIYPCPYKQTLSYEDVERHQKQNTADPCIPSFFVQNPIAVCLTEESHILGEKGSNGFPSEKELAERDYIEIGIHLSARRDTILNHVAEIIDRWQARRAKYFDSATLRWDSFKEHWKIADVLAVEPEIKMKSLASKVYDVPLSSIGRGEEDKISKARNQCLKMMDGGFRNIIR